MFFTFQLYKRTNNCSSKQILYTTQVGTKVINLGYFKKYIPSIAPSTHKDISLIQESLLVQASKSERRHSSDLISCFHGGPMLARESKHNMSNNMKMSQLLAQSVRRQRDPFFLVGLLWHDISRKIPSSYYYTQKAEIGLWYGMCSIIPFLFLWGWIVITVVIRWPLYLLKSQGQL